MIAPQRKAHKWIWLVLALGMPILLFITVKGIDFSAVNQKVPEKALQLTKEGKLVKIILDQPFASPSAVIYGWNTQGETPKPLGQLYGAGTYTFTVDPDLKGILIIDEIKDQELYKTTF